MKRKYDLAEKYEKYQLERFSLLLNDLRGIPGFSKSNYSFDLITKFKSLTSEFLLVSNKAREIAQTKAPEFNIFDLLGVTRDEVRTHSSMLAELLNPVGKHGQGSLFLDSFINMCLEKDTKNLAFKEFLIHPNRKLCSVLTEMHTPYGRMDVVILNPSIGFLCVIENKVGANEQSRQLERYSNWIKTMDHDYPFHVLVFLTVKGFVSATAGDNKYVPLSYNFDIINWLEKILTSIKAPNVQVILQQYCEIAKRL